MKKLILLLALVSVTASAQLHFVTAYHPTWWYGMYRPSMIDYTKMTHLILFPAQDVSSVYPYFKPDAFATNPTETADIITRAHAAGVKVIMGAIGGYGDTYGNKGRMVASDTMRATFINSMCTFARNAGFDGIDLDWEFPQTADRYGWNRLIAETRTALNAWPTRGVLTTSMFYSVSSSDPSGAYYRDSMDLAFDQINLMSYTMWMGTSESPLTSGFDTPINTPTGYTGMKGWGLNNTVGGGPITYETAGWPMSKMGLGISFEGTWFDQTTAFGTSYTNWGFSSTVTDPMGSGYLPIPTANRVWDAQAQANYVNGSTRKFSFQDTNSVKAIVNWAVNRGWGGLMIYDIGTGYDETAVPHDALLRAAWSAAGAAPGTVDPDPEPTPTTSRKYLLRRK
jgi:chitinase